MLKLVQKHAIISLLFSDTCRQDEAVRAELKLITVVNSVVLCLLVSFDLTSLY